MEDYFVSKGILLEYFSIITIQLGYLLYKSKINNNLDSINKKRPFILILDAVIIDKYTFLVKKNLCNKNNMSATIKTGCLHFKVDAVNDSHVTPDYYLKAIDKSIEMPHMLVDLNQNEVNLKLGL